MLQLAKLGSIDHIKMCKSGRKLLLNNVKLASILASELDVATVLLFRFIFHGETGNVFWSTIPQSEIRLDLFSVLVSISDSS